MSSASAWDEETFLHFARAGQLGQIRIVKRTLPEMAAAAAMGVDVELLLEGLERTPAERLRRNAEAVQLLERARTENFTPAQRAALAALEREQLRSNWGDDLSGAHTALSPPARSSRGSRGVA